MVDKQQYNKKIEQLCESDLININNILHVIDSIDFEIMERQLKVAFYGGLLDINNASLEFSDELDRITHVLKEKNPDSFRALLLIQGKDKDDDKQLVDIIGKLVVQRYITLMEEGYLTHLDDSGKTRINKMDSKILRYIYGLVHSLEHEEKKEGADKAMKAMVDSMAKVSKDLFGGNINVMDMSKLFENNSGTGGKIDLSKILGTETKENVDIFTKEKREEDDQ